MFTGEQRERLRQRLLGLAEADTAISGAAVTGSHAGGGWQAEYWISAVRDLVVTLACVRLGYPASYAKGAHLLPAEVTTPLEAALFGSLDPAALRRALAVAIGSLAAELERTDQALAARLNPMLAELGGPP